MPEHIDADAEVGTTGRSRDVILNQMLSQRLPIARTQHAAAFQVSMLSQRRCQPKCQGHPISRHALICAGSTRDEPRQNG
jgi:hypothetical protein